MTKRKIIFGGYDTAAHGWTLSAWTLGAATPKTNYVAKNGGDGSWDLSTALTDGIVKYNTRNLAVDLETSEGNRLEREATIREMINELDGQRVDIELPDDPYHYISGRLHVVRSYNDMAHGAVKVTAVCDPWKYSVAETVINLTASATEKTARLVNNGRRAVVPVLTVTGGAINLNYNGVLLSVSAGTYQAPDMLLTPGAHELKYSAPTTSTLKITYREAVLE